MNCYIDYSDDGFWIVSESPDFPYPRMNCSRCLIRLIEECKEKGYTPILSDAAEFLNTATLPWNKEYAKMIKYPHPECALPKYEES